MYARTDYIELSQRFFNVLGFPVSPAALEKFEIPLGSPAEPVQIIPGFTGWSCQNALYRVSFKLSTGQVQIDVERSASQNRVAVLKALEALVENVEQINGPGQIRTGDLLGF